MGAAANKQLIRDNDALRKDIMGKDNIITRLEQQIKQFQRIEKEQFEANKTLKANIDKLMKRNLWHRIRNTTLKEIK